MRPIKFRAWDKASKRWLDPHSNTCISLDGVLGYAEDQTHALDERFPILMQFTGLLDKNGKEIYEGDVYRTPITPASIVQYKRDGFFLEDERLIEVIGNIYENPELIK